MHFFKYISYTYSDGNKVYIKISDIMYICYIVNMNIILIQKHTKSIWSMLAYTFNRNENLALVQKL